jgi:hypothetical protein
MNQDDDRGLSKVERESLRAVENSKPAPARLKTAIREQLLAQGEIRSTRRIPRRWQATLGGIDAATLIFAAGYWAASPPTGPLAHGEEQWLLLLQGVGGESEHEYAQHAELMRKWVADWIAGGVNMDGSALEDRRWILDADGERQPESGDELEAPSGFILLQDVDLERAQMITKNCPHLEMGGTIELRRLRG